MLYWLSCCGREDSRISSRIRFFLFFFFGIVPSSNCEKLTRSSYCSIVNQLSNFIVISLVISNTFIVFKKGARFFRINVIIVKRWSLQDRWGNPIKEIGPSCLLFFFKLTLSLLRPNRLVDLRLSHPANCPFAGPANLAIRERLETIFRESLGGDRKIPGSVAKQLCERAVTGERLWPFWARQGRFLKLIVISEL